MPVEYSRVLEWLQAHPYLFTALCATLLLLLAWLADWIVKHLLARALHRTLSATPLGRHLPSYRRSIVRRLSNIVPLLILSSSVHLVPGLPQSAVTAVENVCRALTVLTIALAIGGALKQANHLYEQRPNAHLRPIKGYLQVMEIAVYALAAILMIATLVDRSPLILLSGLGAMAAVLLLIFQHTLLSLVASVQISSNDIIRVGDWVQMPELNADGDVIDIALHTVKVQNFDKTITCIPTKRFISDPFKNWRGMQESGGRRIKRSLFLDQNSVDFLDPLQIAHLGHFALLRDYLSHKEGELDEWNRPLLEQGVASLNRRRLTNLGTFRAYVENYLRHERHIRQDMSLLVRQLNPTAAGLPLELYCFTSTTVWTEYEAIQSDIFDHLLAILPEFGLRVFQHPSGADLREWRGPAPAQTENGPQ